MAVIASIVFAIATASRKASAEDGRAKHEPTIVYRRIFVPADAPAKWPRGDEKFLPVESHDFDVWIANANRPAGTARIVEAEYQARLDGERLVAGHARWRVQLADDGPAFMPLDESSLVIDTATWRDDANERTRLGWWSRSAGQPLVRGLQVMDSGELDVHWHTLKAAISAEHFEMPLQLPDATTTRLTLDVPEAKVPTLSGAVVLESKEINDSAPSSSGDSGLSQPAAGNWRRWTWAVGAESSHQLRIEDQPGVRPAGPPTATVREDTRYHVTNQGLDIEVKLECQAGDSELRELDLSLASGEKIISVTADDQEIPWHFAEPASGVATRATIELPRPKAADDITVVVKAWDSSVMQRPWQLPTMQVENAFWTSRSLALTVDEGFEVEDVVARGCTQTGIHQDEGSSGRSSTLEFQSFSPTANVEVRLGPRPPSAHVRTATSLEIGGPTINGRVVAQIQVDRGNLPTISAALQPGWTIDSVETIPAEALGQWHLDTRDGVQRLELDLSHAASVSNPLTVVVTGERRPTEPLDALNRDDLELLHWQGIEVERSLMQLQAGGRYDLKPSSELSPVSADDLSDEDCQLLAAPAVGRLFDLVASPPSAVVSLNPTAANYDADIEYDATFHGEQLQQTYHVVCRPRGNGIDQLLIYFSEPLGAVPRWEDADTHDLISTKRMPESDPRLGGLPPGGELWSLRLRRLYARPISIGMSVETPWAERRPVALVSLPDAASQTGQATIRSTTNVTPAIAVQRMTPAPLPALPRDHLSRTELTRSCAIYRYEPVQSYQAGSTPRLWLGPASAGLSLPGVGASRAKIDSFYSADGSGVHRVTCYLESKGANGVEWKLPDGVRLESVQLDSKPISSPTITTAGGKLLLPLPGSFEHGVLTMELRSAGPPLAQQPQIVAPLPTNVLPMLSGEWNIWMPTEFAAVGHGLDPNLSEFDWKQRLLGPLAWLWEGSTFGPQRPPSGPDRPEDQSSAVMLGASIQPNSFEAGHFDPAGWRAFHTTFAAALPEPIYVSETTWETATSESALLLSLFAAWLCRIPARSYVVIIATAAVLALCLPAGIAPLATGTLWGLMLSPICRWIVSSPDRERAQSVTGQSASGHVVGLAMIAIVVSLVFAVIGSCAEPTTEGGAQGGVATIHRVLVPSDDQGQPVGSKYFVDEQFMRQLLEESDARRLAGGLWLLSNVRCEGKLGPIAGQRPANSHRWTIAMELETLVQDTRIELPLVKPQADWSDSAALDGIPTSIVWNADGVGCSMVAREPGRHQIAIQFEPFVDAAGGVRKVFLDLPPLAGTAFQLDYAPSVASLNVVGGQFDRHDGATGPRLAGELDGSGRLSATWREGTAGESAVSGVHVDELSWLRITRDGVELEVKFVLRGAGAPDAIVISADRSWELLQKEQDEVGPAIESLANSRQSISVPVPSGNDEQRSVTLRFRLRGAVPPGQFRVPPVGVTSVPLASQRLAASIDSNWECEASGGAAVAAGAAAANDFAAMWGESNRQPPQIVVNTVECRPGWFLAVRPRLAESKIEERLAITAARDRLKLRYEAEVAPEGTDRFSYSLLVPEGLSVDRVFATEGGRGVSLEPVRTAPGRVNVFFAAAAPNPFHLVLTGSVPVTDSGISALPCVMAFDRPSARQTVQIYREEGVNVTARNLEAIGPLEQGLSDLSDKTGPKLVGTYLVDRAKARDAQLSIERAETAVAAPATTGNAVDVAPSKRLEETSPPSVRLAESSISVSPAGGWYAVTRYHIAPHGLTQCVLQLPTDQTLISAKLDGHEALVQSIDNQHWWVQLNQRTLPQTLAIVVRGTDRVDPAAHFVELVRPSLWNSAAEIPVEVSLWSLNRPASATSPRAAAAARVSSLEAAVLRLDRLTSIAEASTRAAMEAPTADAYNWFIPRASELLAAKRVVESLHVQANNAESAPALVHSEDDPATLAVARSKAWITRVEEIAAGPQVGDDAATAAATLRNDFSSDAFPGGQSTSFVSLGGANHLTIELAPVGLTANETRASLLALVVGLAGVAIWFFGRPRAATPG